MYELLMKQEERTARRSRQQGRRRQTFPKKTREIQSIDAMFLCPCEAHALRRE